MTASALFDHKKAASLKGRVLDLDDDVPYLIVHTWTGFLQSRLCMRVIRELNLVHLTLAYLPVWGRSVRR